MLLTQGGVQFGETKKMQESVPFSVYAGIFPGISG